jgi:hypothetical protein
MGTDNQLHALVALIPGKEPLYPSDRRVGGPQGKSRECGRKKIFALQGIKP